LCQSASRVKLILGLSSTSKVEDLWTTRLGTAYCQRIPFSLIVVALFAMQNSSHLVSTVTPHRSPDVASVRNFPARHGFSFSGLCRGGFPPPVQ
jgi:hypothetical protein